MTSLTISIKKLKRPELAVIKPILIPFASVLLALAILSIPLLIIKINPFVVLQAILLGAFGNLFAFGNTLKYAVPFIFTSLAFAFAYHSGLFNIGAEGQFQLGALAAVWVGLQFHSLTPILHITLALLASLILGGIWGWLPGVMKAYKGINEIITTIMLNYVGTYLTSLVYLGPLADPNAPYATTPTIEKSAELPFVLPGTRLHAGFILAVVSILVVYFLLKHTSFGLRIRTVGGNPKAARYAGLSPRSSQLISMVISGAIAGIGGGIEVLGVARKIGDGWSSGWGFDGIAVSLLARNNPIGIFFSSIFFGALETGAGKMQAVTGVPGSFALLLQGLPVLFLIAAYSRRFIKNIS